MAQKLGFAYEIQYTKAAEKFFRAHEEVREAYRAAIGELLTGDNPESIDVKRIRGKKGEYYRLRLGPWRVVYAIINGKVVVITTLLAGARGDVYRKMDGLL
jgi:mRNA interferase RelE/StbE